MIKFSINVLYSTLGLFLLWYVGVSFVTFDITEPISIISSIPGMFDSERGGIFLVCLGLLCFICLCVYSYMYNTGGFDKEESRPTRKTTSSGSTYSTEHRYEPDTTLDTVVKVGTGIAIGSFLDG